MNKKILDFPEAAELANDDYIIFDSESGGGCRILAKKIAPVILGIEAIYTQTQEVFPDTPLNDLKQDLVVKAVYRNNRKKVVTDYTLSGTLAVGTSTIMVTYSGFTTTFNVVVTSSVVLEYDWDFSVSDYDRIKGQLATYQNCVKTAQGIQLAGSNSRLIYLWWEVAENAGIYAKDGQDLVLEVDVTGQNTRSTGNHKRFLMWNDTDGFIGRYKNGSTYKWEVYCTTGGWRDLTDVPQDIDLTDMYLFNNSTMKFVFHYDRTVDVFSGTKYIGKFYQQFGNRSYAFGWLGSTGNVYYDAIIQGIRIYFQSTS